MHCRARQPRVAPGVGACTEDLGQIQTLLLPPPLLLQSPARDGLMRAPRSGNAPSRDGAMEPDDGAQPFVRSDSGMRTSVAAPGRNREYA
jgi:hypothetical protein